MYKIQIRDSNNVALGEFDSFMELKFGKRLNNYGSCSFSVPMSQTKITSLIALRQYTVWIYRDITLVWAGEMVMRDGELDNQGGGKVTVYCFDWLEKLKSRYTPALVTYAQIDAGQIFWNSINTSQLETNGDLNITLGTIEATVLRDRTYYNQNILELGVNLSNVISGFDFEITNDRVFNVFSTIGENKTNDIVLQHGHNVITSRINEDFTNPVNRAVVLGEADALNVLQRVDTNDLTSQALIGLREQVLTDTDISELATFTAKGEALNRKYSTRLLKLDNDLLPNSPNITEFFLGDLIRVKVQNAVYNIDEEYRIFEWELVYTDNNEEKLSLILGKFTL